MARATTESTDTLEALAASREVLVTCGSGGVGKTTTAAAIAAMAAVHLGGKVLVLTVDPARRLATAMGIERFGNTETRIPAEAFTVAGLEPRGQLFAAMLDTKASWDDLVVRHAPDATTRDAILGNPLYANISGRFVQSHDYIAMERLYDIHASGRYDLIVVDTPPTRNAIDFLAAPDRMAEFFSSRLLRWLTAPYQSKVFTLASKPFMTVADRILGSQFLADIAEFFMLFQTMHDGFVERADAVRALLSDRRTSFVVVSTLETAPVAETRFFIDALASERLDLGAIVLNKVLPPYLRSTNATRTARLLSDHARPVAEAVLGRLGDDAIDVVDVERVLGQIADSFLDYQVVAKREGELRKDLASFADVVASVPYLTDDVHDLGGLIEIGSHLWH
ncbi:MAG: ArsA family ATPase [Actinobacteria bacterium]|nr:ArsA family ATPase [Actinomycetota bacterium]